EGRLVLGDAVFYANQFEPQVILDFATLTGAAVAALGEDKAAVFNKNATTSLNAILEQAKTMDEMVLACSRIAFNDVVAFLLNTAALSSPSAATAAPVN